MTHKADLMPPPAVARSLQPTLQSWDGLLDWLPVGLSVCDLDGCLVQYNRRAAELWGRSPALGDKRERFCSCYRAYLPNGEPLVPSDAPMVELLSTGRPVRDREVIVERPDGSRVTLLGNLNPLFDSSGRLVGGVNCLQDITEWKQAEEKNTLLLRELAHRVNNTLAIVLAMTQQSLCARPSPESFAEAFTGRLHALAEAHRLLLACDWTGADLADVARGQMAPFMSAGDDRVTVEGPPVTLAPTQVIALGMVLHELATNACQFGALFPGAGRVRLTWEVSRGGCNHRLRLTWTERGGPRVEPPSRRGLGSRFIERGLPDAVMDWRFEPDGVVCLIDLALEEGAMAPPLGDGPSRFIVPCRQPASSPRPASSPWPA